MYVDVFNVFRHGRPRIKNLFAPQFHQRKASFKILKMTASLLYMFMFIEFK